MPGEAYFGPREPFTVREGEVAYLVLKHLIANRGTQLGSLARDIGSIASEISRSPEAKKYIGNAVIEREVAPLVRRIIQELLDEATISGRGDQKERQ